MSTLKSGATLRALLLTPEKIPSFIIPARSPLRRLSPLHCSSPDRIRLLSDPDEDGHDSPGTVPASAASPRFLPRLLPRIRTPRRVRTESADTDVTTRAAMSLPHVEKLTTPYGFRAVLGASPCTRRRESLFHRNHPVTVTVTEAEEWQDPGSSPPAGTHTDAGSGTSPGTGSRRSRIKRLGIHVLKELKKPVAALNALSLSPRRTEAR